MDLKIHISDLQKLKAINNQFQTKLGEITLWLSNIQSLDYYSKDLVSTFIRVLQGFLCHNYFNDYLTQKSPQKMDFTDMNENLNDTAKTNSIYDNSMNLILVISAKIAKMNPLYVGYLIDSFIDHIHLHSDCFNYIISFYRLYISCSNIKQYGKDYGLYNNLFEIYKKIYEVTLTFEARQSNQKMKDLKNVIRLTHKDNYYLAKNDRKYFLDNFKLREKSAGGIGDQNEETEGQSYTCQGDLLKINLPQKGQQVNAQPLQDKPQKFSIFNSFKSSNSKTNIFSRTERRINRLSSDFQGQNATEVSLNSKDVPKIKAKVPMLKFPVSSIDHHQHQHHYSLIRSSRRADISKSGDGSSTTHNTKNNKFLALTNSNPKKEIIVDNSMNRQYGKDMLLLQPRDKLKMLAMQLGESCLATGLAALMNQKRDLELGKFAREKLMKGESVSSENKKYIEKLKNQVESDNEGECEKKDEEQNKNEIGKEEKKSFIVSSETPGGENANCNNRSNTAIERDRSTCSTQFPSYKNYIKIREILANFILTCLKEYSIDEYHLLKINSNLIYCYLILPSLCHYRRKNERKKCEVMELMKEFSGLINYSLSDGSISIAGSGENLTSVVQRLENSQLMNEEMSSVGNKTMMKPNFANREKTVFDSFFSLTFEEEKTSPLSLKCEYDAVFEILGIQCTYLENMIKQQHFYKPLFFSLENPTVETLEFWSGGIFFNQFSKVGIDLLRKHMDPFLDKIKNRISFMLKNADVESSPNLWKIIRQQLDILKDYITFSKSRIISVHILFHLSEILIILKKNFVAIFSKYASVELKTECRMTFQQNISDPNISERLDSHIPESLLEFFISYLEVLSKLISDSNLFICDKYLNETFITCSSFLEVIKFVFTYLLTANLTGSEARSTSNTQRIDGKKDVGKLKVLNIFKDGNANLTRLSDSTLESYRDYVQLALGVINYLYNSNIFYLKVIKKESLEKLKSEEKEKSKYWISSIRDYLQLLYYFLNSKVGIVFEYLINSSNGNFLTSSNSFCKDKYPVLLIHFNLARSLLSLQSSAFEFGHKFSCIVNELSSLDIIRLHYISFIKLYNKNLHFNPNLGEVSNLLATCEKNEKKKTIKAFVKDINNDQNTLKMILILCRLHLKCLFALAKNRNIDVSNKFFQLRIVDYMTKELDLEHEAAEKIYRLKKLCMNTNDGQDEQEDINFNKNIPKIPELKEKDKVKEKEKEKAKGIPVLHLGAKKNQIPKPELSSDKHDKAKEIVPEAKQTSPKKATYPKLNLEKKNLEKKVIIENLELGQDKDDIIFETKSDLKSEKEGEGDESHNDESPPGGEESDDDFGSDYSDVQLVETRPKNNQYEDKVPKLSLIPTAFSAEALGGEPVQAQQGGKIQNKLSIQLKKPLGIGGLGISLAKKKTEASKDATMDVKPNPAEDQQPLQDIENEKKRDNKVTINPGMKLVLRTDNPSTELKQTDTQIFSSQIQVLKPNEPLIHSQSICQTHGEGGVHPENIEIDLNNSNEGNAIIGQSVMINPKKTFQEDLSLAHAKNLNIESGLKDSTVKSKQESNANASIISRKNIATKIQVEIEKHLKKKYNLFYQKAITEELKKEDLSDVNLLYLKERNNRFLYQDNELEVLIISLVMCLIITPARGTLEEMYCSVLPYESNKLNILFILRHHLNRPENAEILPLLLKYISEITPFGVGQRLLKLLCVSLFDPSIYSDWDRIAYGQFGTVYQCSTKMTEPKIVAIKQIDVEKNIFSPCHLFDIFTEITALESFRLEGCVTQLYDYGTDNEFYYIAMKRYPMSLKEWRNKQTGSLQEMLPTYLGIFKDILKAVHIIHSLNTTHYDLKCDNIVIDFVTDNTSERNSFENSSENSICIRVADFGECRIFLNDQDEYCTRSRGTDVIKSPEMLKHVGYQVRTDDDHFDRRKKLGTTRSSDIWSLGCLFYELITGKFLFEEIQENYCEFMYKVEKLPVNEILNEEKLSELNNNPYLVDFLKFMLVKDQHYRPSIDAVMNRFEHVQALLVCGVTLSNNLLTNLSKRFNCHFFEQYLEVCEDLLANGKSNVKMVNPQEMSIKSIPGILKLTADIYIADFSYIENNFDAMIKLGITHVISWTKTKNKELSDKIFYLNLLETQPYSNEKKPVFTYIFKVMDFLRHCMIYRGNAIFADDFLYPTIAHKQHFLMRDLVILVFSLLLNLTAYDTWTYINSKLLFFWIPPEDLAILSLWVLNQSSICNYISTYPVLRCLCGACVLALKRSCANYSLMNTKKCSCSSKQKTCEYSECPSNGCHEYIQEIKNCYECNYESLQWGTFSFEDIFIGPGENSAVTNPNFRKIVFCSRELEDNLIQHSVNEKRSIKMHTKKQLWVLYKCKICQFWMYGEGNERIQILMNNLYNFTKKVELRKKLIKANHLKNIKMPKLL